MAGPWKILGVVRFGPMARPPLHLASVLAVLMTAGSWYAPFPGPGSSETGPPPEASRVLGAGQSSDTVPPGTEDPTVTLIRIEGPISPVTTNYITRALNRAREAGSEALVIELDTPGGLLASTQDIVRLLFGTDVPTVVHVAPDGAQAASAGTFITLAAHIAAMAPSTTIGAASPVTMSPGAQADTVMQQKLFSATESLMETIAERRGRNVEWAISAVREGASATERQALELGVIDLIASSREELLEAIDGREVEGLSLRTAGAEIEEMPRNLAERFLGMIIRPELMLILLLVAIYGIMGEVTNPGAIVPGVAGVVALILLLYASAAMPINIAGFVLLGLAIALFIAEAVTPTFGLLIGAGAVAFFLGALMLFQDFPQPMELPWEWLVPATLLTAGFFVWIATAGLKAQFAETRTGVETLIGREAEVVDRVGPAGGRVLIDGEYWHARSDGEIPEGERCEVVGIDGLTMRVKPARSEDIQSSPTP
jgi:membrane-bound serine protease (ClpP class)